MKTSKKLWVALPVVAAALALGGCGGGVDSNATTVPPTTPAPAPTPTPTPTPTASFIACFTANSTVSFAVTVSDLPAGEGVLNKTTVGPMSYNGQAVTGQMYFAPSGNTLYAYEQTAYWAVTNSGVQMLDVVQAYDNTIIHDGSFYPQNMAPGQTVPDSGHDNLTTFVGFETLTLAGKTFVNTCHMRSTDNQGGNQADSWNAPGYGVVKEVGTDSWQYNGDL